MYTTHSVGSHNVHISVTFLLSLEMNNTHSSFDLQQVFLIQ